MGSKAPTTTSTNSIPPAVLAQYQTVMNRANGVASTPYQPYTGQLTAGLNPTQQGAITALGGLADPTNMFTQSGYNNSVIGENTVGSASPYFQNAAGTIAGAQPYFQNAAQTVAGAQPYFQSAAQSVSGAQPYYQQAGSYANQSASAIDPTQYLSPYNQNVIDTTLQNIQHNNAVQDQGVIGNAIKSGNAFGGDRMGLALSELGRNQDQAANQTIAGLENQNWSQALQTAQAQHGFQAGAANTYAGLGGQQLQGASVLGSLGGQQYQGASVLGGLGNSQVSAGSGLTNIGNAVTNQGQTQSGIGAQQGNIGNQYYTGLINQYNAALQGGTTAQNTDQAALNAQYQQYANAIGFPYQQTGWLSNISSGLGTAQGGTTTTQGSAPSLFSDILGAGTTAAALLKAKRGGVVPHRASGGSVNVTAGFPMAGYPINLNGAPGSSGLIPQITINQAKMAFPKAVDPNAGQKSPQQSAQDFAKGAGGLSNAWDTFQAGQRVGQAVHDAVGPTSIGGANGPMPLVGGSLPDLGGGFGLYARGGLVPGYADGGMTFDDRYAPVDDALSDNTFQPWTVAPNAGVVPPAASPDPVINPDKPYRLEGSYHDNPDNNYPVTADRAAANYRGNDSADDPVVAINRAAGVVPAQPPQALAYDTPRGLAPATGIAPEAVRQANETAPVAGLNPRQDGTQSAGGLLGRMGVTEDGRQALLTLGLGLLANRSPNFGTALGEAGLGAVSSLNEAQKQRVAQSEKDRDYQLQVQRVNQAAETARNGAINQSIYIGADGKPHINLQKLDYETRLANATTKDQYKTIKDEDGNEHLIKLGDTPVDITPKNITTDNSVAWGDKTKQGQDYLATVPKDKANVMAGMVDGTIQPPSSFALAKPYWQKMIAGAKNIDPTFDEASWAARRKMRVDLAASGPSSMGGILANGKSAFDHLATYSGKLADLSNYNGPDVPGGGAVAAATNYVGNKMLPTTTTQGKISGANAAAMKYGQESTKFYSGTGGGEKERLAALTANDAATSSGNSQAGFLQTEKELMIDRLRQKEAQIREQLGDNYLKTHPVFTPELEQTIKKIDKNIATLRGQTEQKSVSPQENPPAKRVRQNGHEYELQSDGSYKAVQ